MSTDHFGDTGTQLRTAHYQLMHLGIQLDPFAVNLRHIWDTVPERERAIVKTLDAAWTLSAVLMHAFLGTLNAAERQRAAEQRIYDLVVGTLEPLPPSLPPWIQPTDQATLILPRGTVAAQPQRSPIDRTKGPFAR